MCLVRGRDDFSTEVSRIDFLTNSETMIPENENDMPSGLREIGVDRRIDTRERALLQIDNAKEKCASIT